MPGRWRIVDSDKIDACIDHFAGSFADPKEALRLVLPRDRGGEALEFDDDQSSTISAIKQALDRAKAAEARISELQEQLAAARSPWLHSFLEED